MPQGAGVAGKLGDRYEVRWVVDSMLDILDEKHDCIRLEPPGTEGEGVEFWITENEQKIYFQIKRQITSRGYWSLSELHTQNVLEDFWNKLLDPSVVHCVFASMHAAADLNELSERARNAVNWQEFQQEFLNGKQHTGNFAKLQQYLKATNPEQVYEFLKRVLVRTVDETYLKYTLENRIKSLIDGDAQNITDVLFSFAFDNLQKELTAVEIWAHLKQRGFSPHQWGNDPHIIAKVKDATNHYLTPISETGIAGQNIPREEAEAILQIVLKQQSPKNIMLTGGAGYGKSHIILQAINKFRENNIPVLAFRVDRLEPTLLEEEMGRQLGLPGSPVHVLGTIAKGRKCVLVIDQLDAISLASGRNSQFLESIQSLVSQAGIYPNLKILFACRQFDIDNDWRIKKLTREGQNTQTVALQELPIEKVKEILSNAGFNAYKFTERQIKLLCLPLNLSLFAEVYSGQESANPLHFTSAKDLFDSYWEYKQSKLRERLSRSLKWTSIIHKLCKEMSDKQVLYVPQVLLDEFPDDEVKALLSEHVLSLENNRFAFFHENFFDYAFARYMAANQLDLLSLLRENGQHLFRRAQVRQILLMLRDSERDNYLKMLSELLLGSDIRFHIKQVVFAVLEQIQEPTEEEWQIVSNLLSSDSKAPLNRQVWSLLRGAPAWFNLVDSQGLIEKWLLSDEVLINETIAVLKANQRTEPGKVADRLEPFIGQSEEWNNRICWVVTWADLEKNRRFFDFFLKALHEGALDQARGPIAVNSTFWDILYSLSKDKPGWTCEAVAAYLNRRYQLSLAKGETNPFNSVTGTIPHDAQTSEEIILKSAEGASKDYFDNIYPFMRELIQNTTDTSQELPWEDLVWQYRWYGGSHTSISGEILQGMEKALQELALNDPSQFDECLKELSIYKNYETIQYLLYKAYSKNGERYADTAIDLLLETPNRFDCGYIQKSHFATKELLEGITPHCSAERLLYLENNLLSFYPEWERSTDGYKRHGYTQYLLLEGIVPSRRSEAVKKRISELQRKFNPIVLEPPEPVEVKCITSPIPEQNAEYLTDEQWLKAIAEYKDDSKFWDFKGGPLELARLIGNFASKDSQRFSTLLLIIPQESHPYYFNEILMGLKGTELDISTWVKVLNYCHSLPGKPCGKSISDAISSISETDLPQELFDIVSWYALNDEDPERELWRTEASSGSYYYRGDILTAGLNSVRGRAADAIGQLLFKDPQRFSYFQNSIERMVEDSSIAVRSMVAHPLIATLNYDREIAITLFNTLCDTEDVLLATSYIERFLFYAAQTHFEKVQNIIQRMLNSSEISYKRLVQEWRVLHLWAMNRSDQPLIHILLWALAQ